MSAIVLPTGGLPPTSIPERIPGYVYAPPEACSIITNPIERQRFKAHGFSHGGFLFRISAPSIGIPVIYITEIATLIEKAPHACCRNVEDANLHFAAEMDRLAHDIATASKTDLPVLEYQYVLHRKFILSYYRHKLDRSGYDWAYLNTRPDLRRGCMAVALEEAFQDLGWGRDCNDSPLFVSWQRHFRYQCDDDEFQATICEAHKEAVGEITGKKGVAERRRIEENAAKEILMGMGRMQKLYREKKKNKNGAGEIASQKSQTQHKADTAKTRINKMAVNKMAANNKKGGLGAAVSSRTRAGEAAARLQMSVLNGNVNDLEGILGGLSLA
ncbi:hypothetical protein QBC34DRAFT_428782 [Podospora aff. communis PSN243]|uniref:Apoptosis regulator Bcl-2 family BH4 domain-containing protein n=1 Tax=Podospora aff. communis PSN243 TaxID=3040156 RepID=A0AAV9GCG2_9PEZI|nr:hypothetical protein QBC34DRAFT_428782 [Podospora aff. communis PSN243]